MDVTDMAELPGGWRQKAMFSFCSQRVKPASVHLKPVFLRWARPAKIFTASGVVDVGENDLPEGGRFGEPKRPNASGATIRR
jgi:hypothetical protein